MGNRHGWKLTHEEEPAPERGWSAVKGRRDGYGRVIEVTRSYGSETYRGTLVSPAGGVLVLREGRDQARLVRGLKAAAREEARE